MNKRKRKTLVYVKIKTKVAIMRTLLCINGVVEQAVAKPIYIVKMSSLQEMGCVKIMYRKIDIFLFWNVVYFWKLFSLYNYLTVSKSSLLKNSILCIVTVLLYTPIVKMHVYDAKNEPCL